MNSRILLPMIVWALLVSPVSAQNRPATTRGGRSATASPSRSPVVLAPSSSPRASATSSGDVAQIVRDLANASTRDKALAQAKILPDSAIVPLSDLVANPGTAARLRADIQLALDAIYDRARAARQEDEKRLMTTWIRETSLNAYLKTGPHAQWDDQVKKGFQQAFASDPGSQASFKSAVDAGCRDPLVRHLYVLGLLSERQVSMAEAIHQLNSIVQDMG